RSYARFHLVEIWRIVEHCAWLPPFTIKEMRDHEEVLPVAIAAAERLVAGEEPGESRLVVERVVPGDVLGVPLAEPDGQTPAGHEPEDIGHHHVRNLVGDVDVERARSVPAVGTGEAVLVPARRANERGPAQRRLKVPRTTIVAAEVVPS